jgi:hypothetical protein
MADEVDTLCGVCLVPLDPRGGVVMVTPGCCGQSIHFNCAINMVHNNFLNCPLCRVDFPADFVDMVRAAENQPNDLPPPPVDFPADFVDMVRAAENQPNAADETATFARAGLIKLVPATTTKTVFTKTAEEVIVTTTRKRDAWELAGRKLVRFLTRNKNCSVDPTKTIHSVQVVDKVVASELTEISLKGVAGGAVVASVAIDLCLMTYDVARFATGNNPPADMRTQLANRSYNMTLNGVGVAIGTVVGTCVMPGFGGMVGSMIGGGLVSLGHAEVQ